MGSKTRARQQMEKAGVPCVPGTSRGLESFGQAERVAEEIGYPLMLKAAAGGGGKGMRLVRSREELKPALESAKSEALRAFGDSEVYVEKLIANPRHFEVQVLADEHGNVVHLGERECSIQRRHQKVLEEAPSPVVDEKMRQRMGEVAVHVSKAAGYTNAGTVEFLVDEARKFYFLEMNTRLQVEHPVTELVTGLDLVHLQIRIAAGEKLPFAQEDVHIRGYAIECRIYAEDPDNNYFPSPGKISLLLTPDGPGVRHDSGMYEGWTVPIDYDPLLAKLIGYGSDRAQAVSRLRRALDEYLVGGIKTNISLFRRILGDQDFQAGKPDTGYLDRLLHTTHVSIENTNYRLELNRTTTGWTCSLNGRPVQLDVALIRPGVLSLLIENQAYEVKREKVGSEMHLWVGNQRYTAELRDPRSLRNLKDGAGRQQGSSRLTAPMPGKVVRLLVNEKDQVEAGQGVVVVEAMKMQNEIKSPKKGIVQKLTAAEGTSVNAGDVLAIVE